jgi:Zn-dependent protease with chaperone function/competence protein ComGC
MQASSQPINLTLESLTLPKESKYFSVALVFSILVWIAILVSVVGIFYAALFALIAWVGNGLLTAYLRSEAVRVDENQLPQLHARFLKVCETLGVKEIPHLYLLQAGGVLNAFATKFCGRNFVVVYSDFLEAFGPDSDEIGFILGHEIGHIKSNHIFKRILIGPGILLPLLGPAYLRACEASCDRHGAFATSDLNSAVRAMMTLSGGKQQGAKLDPAAFAAQNSRERGFFVSWHELTSAYPTLSQRVKLLMALRDPHYAPAAPRNPAAYFFALITPGGGVAGSSNLLLFVVIIGLMAAMAIPAFQKVRQASIAKACNNNIRMIEAAYNQYEVEHSAAPENYDQFIGPGRLLAAMPTCPLGGAYSVTTLKGGV